MLALRFEKIHQVGPLAETCTTSHLTTPHHIVSLLSSHHITQHHHDHHHHDHQHRHHQYRRHHHISNIMYHMASIKYQYHISSIIIIIIIIIIGFHMQLQFRRRCEMLLLQVAWFCMLKCYKYSEHCLVGNTVLVPSTLHKCSTPGGW